jgi:hypothetical protein
MIAQECAEAIQQQVVGHHAGIRKATRQPRRQAMFHREISGGKNGCVLVQAAEEEDYQ